MQRRKMQCRKLLVRSRSRLHQSAAKKKVLQRQRDAEVTYGNPPYAHSGKAHRVLLNWPGAPRRQHKELQNYLPPKALQNKT